MFKHLFTFIFAFIISSSLWADTNTAVNVSTEGQASKQVLLQLDVTDVKEVWMNEKKVLAIVFSHELPVSDKYTRFVTVTKNGVSFKGTWKQGDNLKQLYLDDIQPENDYAIFIRPGITSTGGLKLLTPKHFTITTAKTKANIELLDNGNSYPSDKAPTLKVRSNDIVEQTVNVYRLADEKQADFIKKLQLMPDFNQWTTDDIVALSQPVKKDVQAIDKSEKNRVVREISLEPKAQDQILQQGLYFVTLRGKTSEANNLNTIGYFNISDLDVQIEQASSGLEAIVASKQSAKLVTDANVDLISRDNIQNKKLDNKGYVSFEQTGSAYAAWLWVNSAKNGAILQSLPLVQRSYTSPASEYAQIYLDQENYKTGDQIDFSVLLRDVSNASLADKTIYLRLLNPDLKIIDEQVMVTPEVGHVSGFFRLPDMVSSTEAKPEKQNTKSKSQPEPERPWVIQVHLSQDSQEPLSSLEFYVTETDFQNAKLTMTSSSNVFVGKEDVEFKLKGLLGENQPSANIPIQLKRDIKIEQHPSNTYNDYSFGSPADSALEGSDALETVTLNTEGIAQFQLPRVKNTVHSVLAIKVEAEMQLGERSLVKADNSLTYWPAEHIIGMRKIQNSGDEIGSGITFELISINSSDELQVAENLIVKVYQDRYGDSNLIQEQEFSLTEASAGKLILDLKSGNYKIRVFNPTTQLLTDYDFTVGEEQSLANKPNANELMLSLNKQTYNPSETANLSIKSLYAGDAILKIRSDTDVLLVKKVSLKAGETQVNIPIDKTLSKQKMQIRVYGFHLNKEDDVARYAKSQGTIDLNVDQPEMNLKASLDQGNKVLALRSDKHKDKSAVVIVNASSDGADQTSAPADLPIVQTTFFDKEGKAIVNNLENRVKYWRDHKVDIYFADRIEKGLSLAFDSPSYETSPADCD